MEHHYEILKKASKRFYYSSLFFPKKIRNDVAITYSFCRRTDDIVDSGNNAERRDELNEFIEEYKNALEGKEVEDGLFTDFIKVSKKNSFNPDWVEALFTSMKMDLQGKKYETNQDVLSYIYGVAEVVGLMMAKLLSLPEKSYVSARALGRAMQYSNMIRDIGHDNSLGRVYFSKQDLNKFSLENLEESYILENKIKFIEFIRFEIDKFRKWLVEAEEGYKYIDKRSLIAVKTAADMDIWTMNRIYKNPFIVFKKQIKPSKFRVLFFGLKNTLF